MFEAWSIGVLLRASSNIPQVFAQAGAATGGLNTQLAKTSARIQAAQMQASKLMAQARVSFGVGAIGGAIVGFSLAKAGSLQLAMTTVHETTRATADEMERLTNLVIDVSGRTAQSADTTAKEMGAWARVTGFTYDKLQKTFPLAAKFADVMQFVGRSIGVRMDPVESISVGAQFAHYFQAYSPEQLLGSKNKKGLMDWMVAVIESQAEGERRLLLQGKYFAPLATIAGVRPEDTMVMLGMMGRLGFLRGRGGTAVENMIISMIEASAGIGPAAKGQKLKVMKQLGLISPSIYSKAGGFHMDALINALAKDYTKYGGNLVAMLDVALGKQAAQFVAALASPKVAGPGGQYQQMKKQLESISMVHKQFQDFMADFLPTFQKFTTNLENMFIQLGRAMLPIATPALNSLADFFGSIATFLGQNQQIAKLIGLIIAGGSILALARAVVLMGQFFQIMRAISVLKVAQMGVWAASGAAANAAGSAAGAAAARTGLLARALQFLGGAIWGTSGALAGGRLAGLIGSLGTAFSGLAGVVIGVLSRLAIRLSFWFALAGFLTSGPTNRGEVNHMGKLVDWYEAKYGRQAYGNLVASNKGGPEGLLKLLEWTYKIDAARHQEGATGRGRAGWMLKQGDLLRSLKGNPFHVQQMGPIKADNKYEFTISGPITIKAENPDQFIKDLMKRAGARLNSRPISPTATGPYVPAAAVSPTSNYVLGHF